MAKSEIHAGICGHISTVIATMEGKVCKLEITSTCKAIQTIGQELTEVNPLQEISLKRGTPRALEVGMRLCYHSACPVPVGIIKATEVAARLALPKDAAIKVSKE